MKARKSMGLMAGLVAMILSLAPAWSFADEAPSWWSLPNRGRNCVFRSAFVDGRLTCGTKRYEFWTCHALNRDTRQPAISRDYLLIGTYRTDTPPSCSPTYVVEKVVRQF